MCLPPVSWKGESYGDGNHSKSGWDEYNLTVYLDISAKIVKFPLTFLPIATDKSILIN